MNVKDISRLIKEKKYNEFCDALQKFSPRVRSYIEGADGAFQDELEANVSAEQFQKWRHFLSIDAENEYVMKHNNNLYKLSEEEKKQACLI